MSAASNSLNGSNDEGNRPKRRVLRRLGQWYVFFPVFLYILTMTSAVFSSYAPALLHRHPHRHPHHLHNARHPTTLWFRSQPRLDHSILIGRRSPELLALKAPMLCAFVTRLVLIPEISVSRENNTIVIIGATNFFIFCITN
jgi:hypothetical protein